MKNSKLYYMMARTKRGFTLIEVIIVFALLSIVITAAFSFNVFGIKVLNKGSSLSDIQSDLRLTSDFILNEVHIAKEISLSTPSLPDEYDQIYVSGNMIKYKPSGGSEISKTGSIIINPSTDLLFSINKVGSNYLLKFTIKGTIQSNSFTISSDILLNNIRSAAIANNMQYVYYKKANIGDTTGPTPSTTPLPSPSISPTPTPTPVPTPTPTPTPTITPIPELTALIKSSPAPTKTSVAILFNHRITITSIPTPTPSSGLALAISPDELTITLTTDGTQGNNTNFEFLVTDEYSIIKKVIVHYKNSTQLWDVVQLSDP